MHISEIKSITKSYLRFRNLTNKKLSWCWQTRATHLEVS